MSTEQTASPGHAVLRKPGPFRPIEWAVIVPEAQTHLLEFQWQLDVYETFHTVRVNRLSHAVCFYPLLFTYFVLAALVSLPVGPLSSALPDATRPSLALALAAVLALWYLRLDRLVGLVLVPLLAAMALGANELVGRHGAEAARMTFLAVLVPNMLALTLTHALEPIPPPWSGTRGFVPMSVWSERTPLGARVRMILLTFWTGLVLEYWAAPRFVPIQILKILHLFGYKREMTERAVARAAVLRADFTTR